jgi:accessory colonization factor AcfC
MPTISPYLSILTVALMIAFSTVNAKSQDLRIFGPGGPEPAIQEAASQFGDANGIKVTVTAGPTGKWIDAAKAEADLIYSGSETMITDFIDAMGGALLAETINTSVHQLC